MGRHASLFVLGVEGLAVGARWRWCLAVSLLVVYGIILPGALTNTASAHLTGWSLVRGGHLNYWNKLPGSTFESLVDIAEDEWQKEVGINISSVDSKDSADVIITSMYYHSTLHLVPPIRIIRLNTETKRGRFLSIAASCRTNAPHPAPRALSEINMEIPRERRRI